MRDFATSPAPSYSGYLARRYLLCSESSFIHSPGQAPRAQALLPHHISCGPCVDNVNAPIVTRLRVIHPPTTMENDNRKRAANRLFFSSSNQMNGPSAANIRYARISAVNPNNNPANLLVIRSDSQLNPLNKAIEVSFVSEKQSQKTPREVRPVISARIALARLRSSPVVR